MPLLSSCVPRRASDYPHWEMVPELKCYYLIQASYWCQQLIVLLLNLEKPRKDYTELVAHHFVTLWLVGYASRAHCTYHAASHTHQLELSHQPDLDWERGVCQHGRA